MEELEARRQLSLYSREGMCVLMHTVVELAEVSVVCSRWHGETVT
jgi:hypothetical protein